MRRLKFVIILQLYSILLCAQALDIVNVSSNEKGTNTLQIIAYPEFIEGVTEIKMITLSYKVFGTFAGEQNVISVGNNVDIYKYNKNNLEQNRKIEEYNGVSEGFFQEITTVGAVADIKSFRAGGENVPLGGDISLTQALINKNYSGQNTGYKLSYSGEGLYSLRYNEEAQQVKEVKFDIDGINRYITSQAGSEYNIAQMRSGDFYYIEIPFTISEETVAQNITHYVEFTVNVLDSNGVVSTYENLVRYNGVTFTAVSPERMILIAPADNTTEYTITAGGINTGGYANQLIRDDSIENGCMIYAVSPINGNNIKVFGVNAVTEGQQGIEGGIPISKYFHILTTKIDSDVNEVTDKIKFTADSDKNMTKHIYRADLYFKENRDNNTGTTEPGIKVASTEIIVCVISNKFTLTPMLQYYSPKYIRYENDNPVSTRYLGINTKYSGECIEENKTFSLNLSPNGKINLIKTELNYKLTLPELSHYSLSNMSDNKIFLMTQDAKSFLINELSYNSNEYIVAGDTEVKLRIKGSYISRATTITINETVEDDNKRKIEINGIKIAGNEMVNISDSGAEIEIPTDMIINTPSGSVEINDINMKYVYQNKYVVKYEYEKNQTVNWDGFSFSRRPAPDGIGDGVIETQITNQYDNSATGDETVKNVGKSFPVQARVSEDNMITSGNNKAVFNTKTGEQMQFNVKITGTNIEFPENDVRIYTKANYNKFYYVISNEQLLNFETDNSRRVGRVAGEGSTTIVTINTQGNGEYYYYNNLVRNDPKNNTDIIDGAPVLYTDYSNKRIEMLSPETINNLSFSDGGIGVVTGAAVYPSGAYSYGVFDLYNLAEIPKISKAVWCEDGTNTHENLTKIVTQYTMNKVNIKVNDIYLSERSNNGYKNEFTLLGRVYDNSLMYIFDDTHSEIIAKCDFFNSKRLVEFDILKDRAVEINNYNREKLSKYFTMEDGVTGDRNRDSLLIEVSAGEYSILSGTQTESNAVLKVSDYYTLLQGESNRNIPIFYSYPMATSENAEGVYTGSDNYKYLSADKIAVPFSITLLKKNTYRYQPFEVIEVTNTKPASQWDKYRAVVKYQYNTERKVVTIAESESHMYQILYYVKIKASENTPVISINKYVPLDYGINFGVAYLKNALYKDMTRGTGQISGSLRKNGTLVSMFDSVSIVPENAAVEEIEPMEKSEGTNIFFNKAWNSMGDTILPDGTGGRTMDSYANNYYSADKYYMILPKEAGAFIDKSVIANMFKLVLKPYTRSIVNGNVQFSAVNEDDPLSIGGIEDFEGNMVPDMDNNVLVIQRPVYSYPKINIRINGNEKVTVKNRFDLSVAVDFRQDEVYDHLSKKYRKNDAISKKMEIIRNGVGEYEIKEELNDTGETIPLKTAQWIEGNETRYYRNVIPDITINKLVLKKEYRDGSGAIKEEELISLDTSLFEQNNSIIKQGLTQTREVDGRRINTLCNIYGITANDIAVSRLVFEGGIWTETNQDTGLIWKVRNIKEGYPGFRDIEIRKRGDEIVEVIIRGIEASSKIYGERLLLMVTGTLEPGGEARNMKQYTIEAKGEKEIKLEIPKIRKEMGK